jgi:hypothetical protein
MLRRRVTAVCCAVLCDVCAPCSQASLSCLSFVISLKDIAARSDVTLTLLLTVVAFKLLLSDTLPKVAYLTFLDKYTLFCFFAIFAIAVENAAMAYMTGL